MWPYLKDKDIKCGIYEISNPYSNSIQDLSRFSSKERIIEFSIIHDVKLTLELKEEPKKSKPKLIESVDDKRKQPTSSTVYRNWNVSQQHPTNDRRSDLQRRPFSQDIDRPNKHQFKSSSSNTTVRPQKSDRPRLDNREPYRERERERGRSREGERDRDSYRPRDREYRDRDYYNKERDRDRSSYNSNRNQVNWRDNYKIPHVSNTSSQDRKSRVSYKPSDRSSNSSNLIQLTDQNKSSSRSVTDPRSSLRNEKDRAQRNTSTTPSTGSLLGMSYDIRTQNANSSTFTTKISYTPSQQSTNLLSQQLNTPQPNNPQSNRSPVNNAPIPLSNPSLSSPVNNSPISLSNPSVSSSVNNSPISLSNPSVSLPEPSPRPLPKPNALDPRLNRNRNLPPRNDSSMNVSTSSSLSSVYAEPVEVEVIKSTSDVPSENIYDKNIHRVQSIHEYMKLEKELNDSLSSDVTYSPSKKQKVEAITPLFERLGIPNLLPKESTLTPSTSLGEALRDRSHLKELGDLDDLGLTIDTGEKKDTSSADESIDRVPFKIERKND